MAAEDSGRIAQRYASALFDLAIHTGADKSKTDPLADLEKNLNGMEELLRQSADLRRVIASTALPRQEQGRALDAVMRAAGIGDLFRRFVGVAAANRRLAHLPAMMTQTRLRIARHRGEETAHVTSARPLDDKTITALTGMLEKSVGKSLHLQQHVNPALVGGLVVTIGSRMIDASLGGWLDRLKLSLAPSQ